MYLYFEQQQCFLKNVTTRVRSWSFARKKSDTGRTMHVGQRGGT
jgi:hypothetical protein